MTCFLFVLGCDRDLLNEIGNSLWLTIEILRSRQIFVAAAAMGAVSAPSYLWYLTVHVTRAVSLCLHVASNTQTQRTLAGVCEADIPK